MSNKTVSLSLFDTSILQEALIESFRKLTPRQQWKNPVMFVVYIGSMLTSVLWIQALAGQGEAPAGFILSVTLWLWFTVLFANFAEAMAEGRGKAQADALRRSRVPASWVCARCSSAWPRLT
jgi:K+-transporting ATPase ATPase B chain